MGCVDGHASEGMSEGAAGRAGGIEGEVWGGQISVATPRLDRPGRAGGALEGVGAPQFGVPIPIPNAAGREWEQEGGWGARGEGTRGDRSRSVRTHTCKYGITVFTNTVRASGTVIPSAHAQCRRGCLKCACAKPIPGFACGSDRYRNFTLRMRTETSVF